MTRWMPIAAALAIAVVGLVIPLLQYEATVRLVLGGALVLAALLVAIVGPRILGRRRRAPALEP